MSDIQEIVKTIEEYKDPIISAPIVVVVKKGRPKKFVDPNLPKRPVGRPRTKPIVDPADKRPVGRPRKEKVETVKGPRGRPHVDKTSVLFERGTQILQNRTLEEIKAGFAIDTDATGASFKIPQSGLLEQKPASPVNPVASGSGEVAAD